MCIKKEQNQLLSGTQRRNITTIYYFKTEIEKFEVQ